MHNKPLVSRTSTFSHHLYAALMYAYPPDFRARFGCEMMQIFEDSYPPANAGRAEMMSFWLAALQDFAVSCPNAWWREFQETNESDQPSWMISMPIFLLATFVFLAEGWVAATLGQRLGVSVLPGEGIIVFRISMAASFGLTALSCALAAAMARRKQIDLVILTIYNAA
jgi:hypothetical protein